MRLDKWLSDATSYTRSQLKQLIRSGQVTVNQTIVKKPETPVQETDVICLQGNPVEPAESCYCLLLNKPLGYVCAVTDATEKTVMELIPPELQRKGLFPVGRLDKDTSGMLLLTNDGAFSMLCLLRNAMFRSITGCSWHVLMKNLMPNSLQRDWCWQTERTACRRKFYPF